LHREEDVKLFLEPSIVAAVLYESAFTEASKPLEYAERRITQKIQSLGGAQVSQLEGKHHSGWIDKCVTARREVEGEYPNARRAMLVSRVRKNKVLDSLDCT
jgi:hypothetical protein